MYVVRRRAECNIPRVWHRHRHQSATRVRQRPRTHSRGCVHDAYGHGGIRHTGGNGECVSFSELVLTGHAQRDGALQRRLVVDELLDLCDLHWCEWQCGRLHQHLGTCTDDSVVMLHHRDEHRGICRGDRLWRERHGQSDHIPDLRGDGDDNRRSLPVWQWLGDYASPPSMRRCQRRRFRANHSHDDRNIAINADITVHDAHHLDELCQLGIPADIRFNGHGDRRWRNHDTGHVIDGGRIVDFRPCEHRVFDAQLDDIGSSTSRR